MREERKTKFSIRKEGQLEAFAANYPSSWKLPKMFEVIVIDSEEKVEYMKSIKGSAFIGIDSKPFSAGDWQRQQKPYIL